MNYYDSFPRMLCEIIVPRENVRGDKRNLQRDIILVDSWHFVLVGNLKVVAPATALACASVATPSG